MNPFDFSEVSDEFIKNRLEWMEKNVNNLSEEITALKEEQKRRKKIIKEDQIFSGAIFGPGKGKFSDHSTGMILQTNYASNLGAPLFKITGCNGNYLKVYSNRDKEYTKEQLISLLEKTNHVYLGMVDISNYKNPQFIPNEN